MSEAGGVSPLSDSGTEDEGSHTGAGAGGGSELEFTMSVVGELGIVQTNFGTHVIKVGFPTTHSRNS